MRSTRWLEIVLLLAALALLFAGIISSDSPFLVIRYIFGFIFVAMLPGYCLVNLLFVKENRLDLTEQAILSVALSFGIAGLAGLFLGLSPVGINFDSIIVTSPAYRKLRLRLRLRLRISKRRKGLNNKCFSNKC